MLQYGRRFRTLRQNVFFGFEPKPGTKRQGPPRNQCHSERAVAHAGKGFVHVDFLSDKSCGGSYAWDKRLLACQARVTSGRLG